MLWQLCSITILQMYPRLTTFINKSPLNEGKKQLAIRQAGDYDAVTTRGAINSLINKHPASSNGAGAHNLHA